jgi:hypothetical protein
MDAPLARKFRVIQRTVAIVYGVNLWPARIRQSKRRRHRNRQLAARRAPHGIAVRRHKSPFASPSAAAKVRPPSLRWFLRPSCTDSPPGLVTPHTDADLQPPRPPRLRPDALE